MAKVNKAEQQRQEEMEHRAQTLVHAKGNWFTACCENGEPAKLYANDDGFMLLQFGDHAHLIYFPSHGCAGPDIEWVTILDPSEAKELLS
jgi:hypothetical protein